MVQMKKRHMRGQTETHIPVTLIGYARARAKEILHTSEKVEFKLERGVLKMDPLFLTMNNIPAIAEKFDLYMTREEMIKLEKEIIETQQLLKQLTVALVKNGSPEDIMVTLERVKTGELDLEGLKAMVESLEPKEESVESDK